MLNEISLISSIVKTMSAGTDDEWSQLGDAYAQLKAMASPNSLSKKARNGIYEFPFLISGNIENTSQTATIIKSMEVEYANMIVIAMGINPSINQSTNLKIQRTLSDYHTNANDFSFEDGNEYNHDIQEESIQVAFEGKRRGNQNIRGDYNDYSDHTNHSTQTHWHIHEAPKPKEEPKLSKTDINNGDAKNYSLVAGKFDAICNADYAKMYASTMIKVQLRMGDTKDSLVDIPIGIKGIPHHIPTDEILYVLSSFIKPRADTIVTRFLRWRTGEIRGLHNLLFRYDEIKRDAEFDRRVGTSNSWLKVLRSRANNRRVNLLANFFGKIAGKKQTTKEILPNCTFLLTLADVDTLENETGVNIFQNANAAKKLLDDSMGLGLGIIDEVHEVIHIMYSGYDKFASFPISQLKGKTKSEGDMTKVMLELMKKI